MKDVASRAGVALKTVSRVVNREPGVTPETTKRVLGAIEDLGFRRNESARLLRTGHTATLGYIADTWTDPDHAAVADRVDRRTASPQTAPGRSPARRFLGPGRELAKPAAGSLILPDRNQSRPSREGDGWIVKARGRRAANPV